MKKKFTLIFFSVLGLSLSYPIIDNYSKQEHLLFLSSPLPQDHKFTFPTETEEKVFKTKNNGVIHAIHMKTENPKGVVVYYHGQKVNIHTKSKTVSRIFNSRGFDVIMMDYRGFGKSTGKMNQENFYNDALVAYDWANSLFPENKIVVYGCSLGTSVAAYVASQTNPQLLVLESPYYNMIELAKFTKPFLPRSVIKMILKYPMRTDLFLENVNSSICIFHGTSDTIIPYDSSKKLESKFKETKNIELYTIDGAEHNTITQTFGYNHKLDRLLSTDAFCIPIDQLD